MSTSERTLECAALKRLRAAIHDCEDAAAELGCTASIALHGQEAPEALSSAECGAMLLTCLGGGRHSAHYSVKVAPGVPLIVSHDATPAEVLTLPHSRIPYCPERSA